MRDRICPKCDCLVEGFGFMRNEVIYCCQPCATDAYCPCGCMRYEYNELEKKRRLVLDLA